MISDLCDEAEEKVLNFKLKLVNLSYILRIMCSINLC